MKISKVLLFSFLALISTTAPGFGRASKSMVGESLPALSLDYLRAKPDISGKPVLVEFWATWCPPCRTSIPHLNEVYNDHKDKGLVIIGVTSEKKSVVQEFLKSTQMDYFPALDSDGTLGKQFGVTGIPHAVLVDKTGKIVWEGHPMSLKDKHLKEVLK